MSAHNLEAETLGKSDDFLSLITKGVAVGNKFWTFYYTPVYLTIVVD